MSANYSNLAIHTMTTKSWSILECIDGYAKRGIGGISIWREIVEEENLLSVRRKLEDSELKGISYVRGGFFTGETAEERSVKIEENKKVIEECDALGLPMIVLVCGATPGQLPKANYEQIRDGIGEIAPLAAEAGIKLAIEPLHPVYCGDRSGIYSLGVANDLCAELSQPNVGVALDVYHVWWDMELEKEIQRCAENGWLYAYHICDFKPDQNDILTDRGIMGEGCIPLREIDLWVQSAGFDGPAEVEVFSKKWWADDQEHYLDRILESYEKYYQNDN
ncbi:MAG: sugar phosphate isomerase/epimerase family protein [Verrucomicrobiota bacterium]